MREGRVVAAQSETDGGTLNEPRADTDVELLALTPLKGVPRLKWVLAHDYGHIACQTRDEKKAERAAGHLQYGKRKVAMRSETGWMMT